MATIKEVAALSNTSVSTASIVLRGDGDERKISKTTQDHVLRAAKELGYQPNTSARKLREKKNSSISVAVFWADDFRLSMAVRFMRGLQNAIRSIDQQVEFSFFLYQNDELSKQASLKRSIMFNAVIICNASQTDMLFLEKTEFPVPIVLYNRHSVRHCTVNVSDHHLGSIPARIFARLGHKVTAMITSYSAFPGMDVRAQSFLDEAKNFGLTISSILETENSMAGGFQAAAKLCNAAPLPDCLFCASDAIAVGVLRYFNMKGIKIPEELELISLGNGDQEQAQYTCPPLSVVYLPMEDMAQACFNTLLALIKGEVSAPYSVELPITYIPRESCRAARWDDIKSV